MKRIAALIFLILAIAGCTAEGRYDEFAQCLSEENATMFGTDWCSHCQNQKAAFRGSFEHIDYVDCDEDRAECDAAGVRGYPTWRIDGDTYAGEQSLQKLSALTGCSLE